MPKVDKELIQRKIKLVESDLSKLKDYRKLSLEQYLGDEKAQLIAERLLEKITGRIIDINYHILREGYEIMPEDYYNSFIEMGKNRVITGKFAEEMAKSAGLRNALAHEYEEINQKLVHASIRNALTQVPKYLREVLNFLV